MGVSTAGDLNGDGYSDIIIGIPEYNNPGSGPPQGRAFVYFGKPTGVNAAPDIIITDNVNNKQFFGASVAAAGDVNGDGFSDIVVGGYKGSWSGFGMAWIYKGNNKGGLRNNLRLYNTNLATPMTQSNINDGNSFGAGLYAKSYIGKQKGKLVWQTISNGNTFTGSPITNSTQYTAQQIAYTNLGLNGIELKTVVTKTTVPPNTYTRVRVKYDPVTAVTGQVYGPWRYPAGYLQGSRAIADVAMTTLSHSVTLGNDTAVCFPYTINATTAGASSYTWQNGATGPTFNTTAPGLYWVDILLHGCTYRDSIVLTVATGTLVNLSPKICQNQTYTSPTGNIYNTTGIYYDTLRSVAGCDSMIYTIDLTVQSATTQLSSPTICVGQNYTLPWGTVVSTPGTYRDTLRYTITNCDSVYRIVDITVQTTGLTEITNATICEGQTYTLPWGTIVSSPGIYRDTLRYVFGCDSIYRIVTLSVQTPALQIFNPVICAGQTYTLPWGIIVNTAGIYRDTLYYTTGCDSVRRTVNLTVQVPLSVITNPTICDGQSYTLPWGTVVNTAGIYRDTLHYTTGCDSVRREVNLIVQSPSTVSGNAVICFGQTYTLPWGGIASSSGTYRDTLRYATGCDSVRRIINLIVQTPATLTTNPSICQGASYTLPWGIVVNTPGIYRDTLHYATGCDSIRRIVNLQVTAASIAVTSPAICFGETYTLPWGTVTNIAGIYKDTVKTAVGCDSLIRTVNLTVDPVPSVTISKSNDVNCVLGIANLRASGGIKYIWTPAISLNNATIHNPVASPTTTTWYRVLVTSDKGCTTKDSIQVKVINGGITNGYLLPNAFTPNGDGKNDCFGVSTWGNVGNLKLKIFNRWGELVFSTTDPNKCWDGTYKGVQQPFSVFIYQISAETFCGPVQRNGTVTLIR
jgi:gliding motility-associated-like protein